MAGMPNRDVDFFPSLWPPEVYLIAEILRWFRAPNAVSVVGEVVQVIHAGRTDRPVFACTGAAMRRELLCPPPATSTSAVIGAVPHFSSFAFT